MSPEDRERLVRAVHEGDAGGCGARDDERVDRDLHFAPSDTTRDSSKQNKDKTKQPYEVVANDVQHSTWDGPHSQHLVPALKHVDVVTDDATLDVLRVPHLGFDGDG